MSSGSSNPPTGSLRLSPSGTLHFEHPGSVNFPHAMQQVRHAFDKDWREGWFCLAANKAFAGGDTTIRFWQEIAAHYLTMLCHLPHEMEYSSLGPPEAERLTEWLLRAPPMVGGEYLSQEKLSALWEALNRWVEDVSVKCGGIHCFLTEWAPLWQQVGRVCFHLAENKNNPDRPFAFLATYSTGFGAGGKLKHLPLREALKQYSASNDKQALINLLTPVHSASRKCPWVQELTATAELYQPLAWSAQKAYKLLSSIPQLEESGLSVRIPDWWKRRPRPQVSVTVGSLKDSKISLSSMLDFKVRIAIGDEELSEEELLEILASGENLAFVRGQWVEVDREKLQEALKHWKLVQKNSRNGEISFIEGMRLLAGTSANLEVDDKKEENEHWVKIAAGDELAKILQSLRDPSRIPSENPEGLTVTLRPYQQEGVNWLSLLSGLGLGACLADDMGLGKTIQVLSLLLLRQKQAESSVLQPSLLILPASLLGNWKREADRFAPSLKLFLLHPSETSQVNLAKIEENPSAYFQSTDLVVTTYSMVVRLEWLSSLSWNLLILDEAQAIKNAGTKQTKAIKGLKGLSRIALTGTPIENRLSDLWSLFDFLNPGLLGTDTRFKKYITSLQEHVGQFDTLRKLVGPYILRRMKTDPKVITDLPAKVETPTYCRLTKSQAGYYQAIVDELRQTLEQVEPQNRRGAVLKALMQLKQICNHPSHYSGGGDYDPLHSGKFERLGQICEELASRQEKVLIFTQFSEIIAPLEEFLSRIFGRSGLILHGGTPIKARKSLVDAFQCEDGPPFFVLSLKAGGTGLTLTAASHVIHFDRWWNPAVENQATDRAFRIGQKKNVQVHTFITQGTVEEQIDAIIDSKKKLANDILSTADEVRITELGNEELITLLTLDINRATAN